jgi:hypothetical protein
MNSISDTSAANASIRFRDWQPHAAGGLKSIPTIDIGLDCGACGTLV